MDDCMKFVEKINVNERLKNPVGSDYYNVPKIDDALLK